MTDSTAINTPVTVDAPLTDETTLSWVDASTVTTKKLFVPKFGKYVEYRTFVPLDIMASIQARYMTDRKDYLAYMLAILKYVMVAPTITTPEAERAVSKADSGLVLQIVGDVVNSKEAEEIKSGLGNA